MALQNSPSTGPLSRTAIAIANGVTGYTRGLSHFGCRSVDAIIAAAEIMSSRRVDAGGGEVLLMPSDLIELLGQ